MIRGLAVATVALVLSGCASWSTGTVNQEAADGVVVTKTAPEKILISDADMPGRAYRSLGDITVNVNKTTVFNADPTPQMVNDALRAKASELGADAVILVRYGKGGISFMSWGSMEGKGRAIKFTQ